MLPGGQEARLERVQRTKVGKVCTLVWGTWRVARVQQCGGGQCQAVGNSRRRMESSKASGFTVGEVLWEGRDLLGWGEVRSGKRLVWAELGEVPLALALAGALRKDEGMDRIGEAGE